LCFSLPFRLLPLLRAEATRCCQRFLFPPAALAAAALAAAPAAVPLQLRQQQPWRQGQGWQQQQQQDHVSAGRQSKGPS